MTGNYSFRLNLGQVPPLAQGRDYNNLLPIHSAVHNLAQQLDIYVGRFTEPLANYPELGVSNINSILQNKFYAQADDTIDYGDLVYFLASGTTVVAKRAIASSDTTLARGIYLGVDSLTPGSWGEYILSHTLLTTTALTPGITYYLSATSAGDITATPPIIAQVAGWALSDTILLVQLGIAGAESGGTRTVGTLVTLDSIVPTVIPSTSLSVVTAETITGPTTDLSIAIPTITVGATSP